MKIEKIELSGFKSFAEKTTIHLHHGITGIVGPNGCGKSNIVDAIKWLLGEQSVKSLRGDRMEELIFNGSATRKPKGMAEVSLYISGLPTALDENGSNGSSSGVIEITRRIYRSGDSEYAINRNICRLKDIKELLLDTGLDIKNYFILEQERIFHLVNTRPEERRFLIEEIAGVIKYKVKKAEALQKLEQSKINLQRINDIIGEVKRQLNSLERQVKKAERFKRLSEERRIVELYLARLQFNELKGVLSGILEDLNSLKAEEASKRAAIASVDNVIQQGRLVLLEKEKRFNALYSELEERERRISEKEKILLEMELKAETYKREGERLESEREENLKRIDEFRAKVDILSSKRGSLKEEMEGLKRRLEELSGELSLSEKEITSLEQGLEEKRRSLFRLTDELNIRTNERTRLQAILDSLEKRYSGLEKELEEMNLKLKDIEIKIEKGSEEIRSSSEEILSLRQRRDEIVSEIETLEVAIESKRQELQETKERLASNISRLNSLKELILEGKTPELLKKAEDLQISGLLSDLFDVSERYERAVEGILGERINAFVLSDLEDLKKALRLIKELDGERSPFAHKELLINLPVESHYEVSLSDAVRVGEILRVPDEGFREIINRVLSSALIVGSIDDAIRIKKDGYPGRVATPDGDVIDESGIVWSGKGKEVLKRKREIKELEGIIDNLKRDIEKKTEELQEQRDRLSELEKELRHVEDLIDTEEARLTDLRHNLDTYQREKERVEKRISYIHIEKEEALKERDNLSREIKKRELEITTLKERRKALESEIEGLRNSISALRERIGSKRQEYTELRADQVKATEAYNSLVREIEGADNSIGEITKKNEELLKRIEDLHREREHLLEMIEGIKKEISGYVEEVASLRDRIELEREEIQEEGQRLMEMEEGIKGLRAELEDLLRRINEMEVQRAEIAVKVEGIKENISLNYGVNIEEVDGVLPPDEIAQLKEMTAEELSERLISLRKKIEDLGPVNLGTLEEYEELKERFRFLTSQQEDLTKSISELEEAIQKINATTRKRLREAFDALNTKFQEVFTSLFGGGKASLVLTDENNILESGIEIIAQPPGKRLQNINLLSGGEKALTALSLLIASFIIKPAPLCVLDEVDAPLDDSNIERFAQMIKELSRSIQFIVITHNKTTISYCDYLYGVTMEEPGVSKIISLQLSTV